MNEPTPLHPDLQRAMDDAAPNLPMPFSSRVGDIIGSLIAGVIALGLLALSVLAMVALGAWLLGVIGGCA